MKTVRTPDGQVVHLEGLLGEGGQGTVYRARHAGQVMAAKLYHPAQATRAQREALTRLIARGAPDPVFLWPSALVEASDGRFGYLMPLREARFRSTEDFMSRRISPSPAVLLMVAVRLTEAFMRLHARGLCYRDISFANVSFDPTNGDVCILDNDNVDEPNGTSAAVLGTPRFMAPEVVRGDANPSADTDRFSLAVLLFYLLYGGHPLEGAKEAGIRCLDAYAMKRLYGDAPLFIFDPHDAGNAPVPGIHDNPRIFRNFWSDDLFAQFRAAFTGGLNVVTDRPRESVWRSALVRELDALGACGGCAAISARETGPCWKCGQALRPSLRLRFANGSQVRPRVGARLWEHHVGKAPALGRELGQVVAHPQAAGVMGLKNASGEVWTIERADGSRQSVDPGRSVVFSAGSRLFIDGGVASFEV